MRDVHRPAPGKTSLKPAIRGRLYLAPTEGERYFEKHSRGPRPMVRNGGKGKDLTPDRRPGENWETGRAVTNHERATT